MHFRTIREEPGHPLRHWRGMLSLETLVGFLAAFCTTISYVPQVRKCWQTHSTGDLSLKMILLLSGGIALWVVYGIMREDAVIIVANSVSLLFLTNLLAFKLKEVWATARGRRSDARGSAALRAHK
jgi:MtN3 and saliva related transmembrane protein